MISKQLALLTAHKEVFIRKYNEKAYDDKVVALLEQLPNPVEGLVDDAVDDDPGSDAASDGNDFD